MRITVNGSKGKMGQAVVNHVEITEGLSLADQVDLGDSLSSSLAEKPADIVVDFTRPETRMENVKTILFGGAAAVVFSHNVFVHRSVVGAARLQTIA